MKKAPHINIVIKVTPLVPVQNIVGYLFLIDLLIYNLHTEHRTKIYVIFALSIHPSIDT